MFKDPIKSTSTSTSLGKVSNLPLRSCFLARELNEDKENIDDRVMSLNVYYIEQWSVQSAQFARAAARLTVHPDLIATAANATWSTPMENHAVCHEHA